MGMEDHLHTRQWAPQQGCPKAPQARPRAKAPALQLQPGLPRRSVSREPRAGQAEHKQDTGTMQPHSAPGRPTSQGEHPLWFLHRVGRQRADGQSQTRAGWPLGSDQGENAVQGKGVSPTGHPFGKKCPDLKRHSSWKAAVNVKGKTRASRGFLQRLHHPGVGRDSITGPESEPGISARSDNVDIKDLWSPKNIIPGVIRQHR